MAYDKELPKNYFVLNDRTYPENLPVYWSESKNDWQVSSEENPLPTGDYGMTEGGVWIPKKVSDDGAAHTQLTGSNMDIIDIYYDVEVPARATTRLDSVDCSDYKDLYMQYVPRGLTAFTLRCYIVRASGLGDLTGMLVEERSRSSNGVTERFQINSTRVSAAITNDTDEDHVFGELFLVGVKR